ncbi:hypothetical protein SNK03_002023 [Fusarium graminearum]
MKSESTKSPPKSPRELEATESIANGHIIGSGDAGMKKTFSFLGILALGFNISNSWVAIASSLALSIAAGGTVTILYGILVVGFAMICTGFSLAELASVYPTAGGQYHLTSILAPERFSKGLSYTCGMLGVFSWISIGSSIALIVAQTIMALVIQYHPDLTIKSWHYFLLYVAVHVIAVLYNLFLAQRTEWIYKLTFTSIACPSLTNARANSSFVWTTFYNNSELWPDGICFLTGLSGPSFMLIGLDATMHLAEECSAPAKTIPKAIISTVLVGVLTAFAFAVAMCYSTDDFESLLTTPTGFPIYALWHQATGSLPGATVLMVALLCVMMSALNAVHQTASRLTWSSARDDAIVLAKYLKLVHPRLHMPVYALLLNFVFCVIAGALYPASTSALERVSTGVTRLPHTKHGRLFLQHRCCGMDNPCYGDILFPHRGSNHRKQHDCCRCLRTGGRELGLLCANEISGAAPGIIVIVRGSHHATTTCIFLFCLFRMGSGDYSFIAGTCAARSMKS